VLTPYRKPVHGLIFLYQYVEEEPQEETEGGDKVWFANQITDNACATLALFNIIMNAKDIELGDRLKAFKEKSSDLIAPHKGHLLCNTTWIRSIHNQFSRRLDLLNADLSLANEVDKLAKQKKKAKKPSGLHVAKKQKKLKKPTSDAAYHFVAYVPVDNDVYQLDGLEKAPVSIGKVDRGDDWTAIARPFIESRMLQYQEESLQFNLLAACRSPLVKLREELATNIDLWITAVMYLSMQKRKRSPPEDYDENTNKPEGFLTFEHPDIEQYGLARNETNIDLIDYDKCKTLRHWLRVPSPRSDAEIEARIEELQTEQARIRSEYNTEAMMDAEGVSRAKAQKKDFTPVIHQWVQMLADKGVLGDIAKEVKEG
jgi:ubiquitin carboxyl-terminal hydrolase L5